MAAGRLGEESEGPGNRAEHRIIVLLSVLRGGVVRGDVRATPHPLTAYAARMELSPLGEIPLYKGRVRWQILPPGG